MKYIKDEQIRKMQFNSRDLLNLVNETLKYKRDSILPPKISMHLNNSGDTFYNCMPCLVPSLKAGGVKLVNRYPNNSPCLKANLMLYDLNDGDLLAFMDAEYITSLRTAAVAIHSVHLFAKNNYESIGFIGLGEVGKLSLKMFIDTIDRNITIRIFNYKNRAYDLIKQYTDRKNIKFEAYDNYNEFINGCDVIVSAVTYCDGDFASPDKYKNGCLLVPVHTRGFMACDLAFDNIFGDDVDHLQNFKYFNQWKSFAETCEVVNGTNIGRSNDEERIIVYNVGIALHDIVFAKMIFDTIEN